jgi:tocopherol O-methyltransferase
VAEHYDELDPFYRELWGEHLHHGLWRTGSESPEAAVVRLVERAAEAVDLEPRDRVCDVGCGYGAPARLLARRFGARVVGYTLSKQQAAVARRTDRPGPGRGPRYVLGDWLENDLPTASFDAVLAIESTEHMRAKMRFFTEAWRVLRPGGRLTVCAWTVPASLRPWQRRHLIEPLSREGSLAPLATVEEYRSWVHGAGFDGIWTEELTEEVRRTWDVVLRRTAAHLLTRPATWQYLLDCRHRHRGFAKAVLRIRVAYGVGALRYTILTAQKPE